MRDFREGKHKRNYILSSICLLLCMIIAVFGFGYLAVSFISMDFLSLFRKNEGMCIVRYFYFFVSTIFSVLLFFILKEEFL